MHRITIPAALFLALASATAGCSSRGSDITQQIYTNGRDPGAAAGFDLTKLGAAGTPLAIQDGTWSDAGSEAAGTQWSCVLDHVTGLWWEVKTNDGGLRDKDWLYTSYDSDYNDGPDTGTYPPSEVGPDGVWAGPIDTGVGSYSDKCGNASGICTTEQYVEDVNTAGLCGKTDWRMPTFELLHLFSTRFRNTSDPEIVTPHFPNTSTEGYLDSAVEKEFKLPSPYWGSADYWSSTPFDGTSNGVMLRYGYSAFGMRNSRNPVRLVRGAQ